MINKCIFMGRIAQNLELRKTASGVSVCSFSLAVQRRYKKDGEDYKTDWIDCVAFKKAAEFICNYFSKGELIAVIGEMQTRTYKDKNGNNRKATELIVEQVSFCGSKTEHKDGAEQFQDFTDLPDIEEDDLPF